MSVPAAFLGDFGEAIKFIFQERESVSGGVQIGGIPELAGFGATHMIVSVAALAIAAALAIPFALWLGHIGRGDFLATATSNVGRAVPSLALLAFFISFVGLGYQNVIAVLVLLAIPPLITNTYVGMRQVDRDTVDAARGQGMTGMEIVRKVELPLALPTIFGGLRTSAVNVVATATIAPLANVRTLGEPIITPQTYGFVGQLGAAIVVAVITLTVDFAFARLQRAVTPAGLKLAEPAPRRWFSRLTKRRLDST
ncbi:MAG: osmoprotectant transport system substrate-binding protein opuBD [Solirubrobacteraceae bacterium]|jgi:osmoprotectant transport system permease protein|nr:osmoprotectant transport system substrate-binding protein opuBD [Solirubrobacteraceae bacterium]